MKHNKKRNVGIIYELMLKHMSNCLVDNNIVGLKKATKIFEKRFAKHTELYKEFRLFNALAQSTVSDTHIVASILSEAKRAARNFNKDKLLREKSLLIKDINHIINDKQFYYRNLDNYKDLATIQLAINEWRKQNPDLKKLISLEKNIGELLLKQKDKLSISEQKEQLKSSDSDNLIFKIMSEKINKKYDTVLTTQEKDIIQNYVLYENNKNHDVLKSFLTKKQNEALKLLENFKITESNKILLEKVDNVSQQIKKLDTNEIKDSTIVKFLTLTKLVSELQS